MQDRIISGRTARHRSWLLSALAIPALAVLLVLLTVTSSSITLHGFSLGSHPRWGGSSLSAPATLGSSKLMKGGHVNGEKFLGGGIGEGQPALDPGLGLMFVPDQSGSVTVINTTTNSRVGAVSGTFAQPTAAVYDPAQDRVYVSNSGNGSIALVNPHSLKLTGLVPTSASSRGPMLYLNDSNSLLVADNSSGAAYVVDPVTGFYYQLAAGNVTSFAWDPATDVAVATANNSGSNFLWAFDDTTGLSNSNLSSLPRSTYITYDAAAAAFVTVNSTGGVAVYPGMNITPSGFGGPLFTATLAPSHGAPSGIAYDPAGHTVVVTRQLVTFYSSAFWTDFLTVNRTGVYLQTSIPGGFYPNNPTFDPANSNVYIPGLTRLMVVGATSDSPVASRNIPHGPGFWFGSPAAYVPPTNQFWVPDPYGFIDAISEKSHAIQASFFVGSGEALMYDPALGQVLVAGYGGNLYAINVTSHNISTHNLGPGQLTYLTYDPVHSTVVVSEDQYSTLRVVGARNLTLLANLSVSSTPTGGVFDPATGEVVVADFFGANLSIVNGTQHVAEIPTTYSADGVVFDPQTQQLTVLACTGVPVEFYSALTYAHVATGAAGAWQASCSYQEGLYDPADAQVFIFGRNVNASLPDAFAFNSRDQLSGYLYGTYAWQVSYNTGIVIGTALDPVTGQILVVAVDGLHWIAP